MKASLLLALCVSALATVSVATTETLAAANAPEPHLRSLRDLEEAADNQAAKTAVHRVYDAVTGLYCERVGDCHVCPASEKEEVYCRETGHRQELSCFKSDTVDANAPEVAKEMRFQSCEPTEKTHPLLGVFKFELMMAAILAGSFVLLQRERRKHMSAFDLRKDPRQRSTLLGGDKNTD